MKRLIYTVIVFVLPGLFLSCKKMDSDYVDGKTPEERGQEYIKNVRNTLESAPSGWVAYVTTPSGLGFTYYMDFKDENRVRMYGDFTLQSMTEAQESSYALRNTGIPSLLFDSHNYIHLPADPNPNVNGGTQGIGLSTDFEFSIKTITQDTLNMTGNLRNNSLTLVRLNSTDRAAVESQGLLTNVNRLQNYFSSNLNNYVTVTIGGQERKVGISYSHVTRQLAYSVYETDGQVSSGSTTFHYSVNGMEIVSSQLVYNNIQFKSARFRTNGALYLLDAAGVEYDVTQNPTPLIPFEVMFGQGKTYPVLRVQGENLPVGVVSEWNSVYSSMVTRFNGTGRTIAFVELTLASPNRGFVVIRYAAASAFSAIARFNYTIDDNQVMTITNWDSSSAVANTNWTSRNNEVGSFATWFQNQGPFKLDWVSGADALMGGLYPVNNPNNFFHGILRETPEIGVAQYL